MNKLLSAASLMLLAACTTTKPTTTTIPGEFANMDYELSTADAERWVAASKQAEACIYPKLTRIQQSHFSKEDSYIHSQYVFFYPLEEIIGENYVRIIQNDEKSMGYAQYQFKQFKANTSFSPLDTQQCHLLREKAKADLDVVKGIYRSGMVEAEQKNSNPNEKGVATDQNKFFFDIIKWGAALLL